MTHETTYERSMGLKLTDRGSLEPAGIDPKTGHVVWHAPLEIPPVPAGIDEEAWQALHRGFETTSGTYNLTTPSGLKTVFQMTEAERIQWCVTAAAEWAADEAREGTRQSDRERDAEAIYYSGYGDRVGLDPFAYDSQGNDTGLRTSDFI